MKKYIILVLMIITFGVCSNVTADSNQTKENNATEKSKNVLIIDLDKETEDTRGGTSKIVNGPIFLNNDNDEVSFIDDKLKKKLPVNIKNRDNDEVSFIGDILEKSSPVKIKIGDNDEVSFSGREYNIRTLELKDGDHIIIKDKDGKVFVDKVVREY